MSACAPPASISPGIRRDCPAPPSSARRSIARPSPSACVTCCGASTARRSSGRRPDMSGTAAVPIRVPERLAPEAAQILAALPDPVLVVGGDGLIEYANAAAEQFFDASTPTFLGAPL